jgi:hemoglobin
MACFDEALAEVGLAGNDRLRQVLRDYFGWATTTTMSPYVRSATTRPKASAIHTGPGTDSWAEPLLGTPELGARLE